jgi:hypothetical protein
MYRVKYSHYLTRALGLQGKAYDTKTDVWAAGCVLYELCALKRAFDGNNLGAITVKIMGCTTFSALLCLWAGLTFCLAQLQVVYICNPVW